MWHDETNLERLAELKNGLDIPDKPRRNLGETIKHIASTVFYGLGNGISDALQDWESKKRN